MAIVLQIRKAGSPFQQKACHFAADWTRGGWACHCRLAFYELLTESEARERPCLHSSKLVFLLSARSPIPLSELCWCQRMWSHCLGKVLGGGGRRGGPRASAGPSCLCAEFLLHLCRLMLQSCRRAHVPELQMNCSRKMCRNDEETTSSERIAFMLAMEPKRKH